MIGWNSWKACGNLTATPEETPENNCSFFTGGPLPTAARTASHPPSFAHLADLPLLPATGIAIVAGGNEGDLWALAV
jgi:hypothetical protein